MSEFNPVESKADMDCLNADDIVAGYLYGITNPSIPGSDKSRGFWHGWRNAQTDYGRAPLDLAQQRLFRDILGSGVHTH